MYVETVAKRAETLTYLSTGTGQQDVQNTLNLFETCVASTLNGFTSGSEFGRWALIVDNARGGVGYSGSGAGMEHYSRAA